MVSQRRQAVVLTAVPRGYARADSLRLAVHVSPRLSYVGAEGSATLADFADWQDWPGQQVSWQVSFDGTTWVDPTSVRDVGDPALWRSIFRPELPVRSFTGAPTPVSSVLGYSYATLARGLDSALAKPTLGASTMGAAAAHALASPMDPGRGPTAEVSRAMREFAGFYQRPKTVRDHRPGNLDPDFHERLSLLADHGPLLDRLGLVVELAVPVPGKAVHQVQVRAHWSPASGVATTQVSPRTVCVLRTTGDALFVAARRKPGASVHDERLRLRLDDTTVFSVHSLDVDGATAQVLGVAAGQGGKQQQPPAGRSGGLTLAQLGRMADVNAKITFAADAAKKLSAGHAVDLYAEDLVAGHHVQVGPRGATGTTWYGIGHRQVTYSAASPDGGTVGFRAVDEAAVTIAARQSPTSETTLLVSDVVARWDGWSIAVRRPGRMLLQSDPDHSELADGPERADLTWLTMDTEVPTTAADGTDGRLPTLRYGRGYALRARAVDITGAASTDWTGAPTSPETAYRRWDPVPAPLVLPTPTLTAGETARTLVVRSDPRTGMAPQLPASRTLAPPRVSVDVGLLHGVFDVADGTPDPARWDEIATLDETLPPVQGPSPAAKTAAARPAAEITRSTGPTPTPTTTASASPSPTGRPTSTVSPTSSPTPDETPGEPRPLPVTWLPDPMATGLQLFVSGMGARDASFLPATATSPTGVAEIGHWWSVAFQVRALGAEATVPVLNTTEQQKGQQVVRLDLPPADVRKVWVRAQPPSELLGLHGLVDLQPGTAAQKEELVRSGGLPILTPEVELTVVHAVRMPLEDPTVSHLTRSRTLGTKDPTINLTVGYHPDSTSRVAVIASWEEWRDDGPGTPPPTRVEVSRHTVFEREVDSDQPVDSVDLSGRTAFPDLRRRDVTLTAVATSRFVPEFREALTDATWALVDGVHFLQLPPDVQVESLVLDRTLPLVRGTDYDVADDPGSGQRTIRLLTTDGPSGITVSGVRGSILAISPQPAATIVRSAVRPDPPRPTYAVPAFKITPGHVGDDGFSRAERGPARLRIWLERPWWSSGDGETLAVITSVDDATVDASDTARLARLVTTFGADPAVRTLGSVSRLAGVTSGIEATRLVIREELDPAIEKKAAFNAHLHEVTYDAGRDAYWAEVEFPDLPAGAFVRLALARHQPQMSVPSGGNLAEAVRLSRIVTMDPVQLLPARSVEVRRTSTGVAVVVNGTVHRGPDDTRLPFVRVSVQRKGDGGPDLGWETVAVAQRTVGTSSYPTVTVSDVPNVGGELRVLVEELEVAKAMDTQGKPTGVLPYDQAPDTALDAIADLIGLRPVWVATLPMPER